MKKMFSALVLSAVFSLAHAAGGEGNNTGCNGQGNPNSPCQGTGGAGGAGGQGGAGGTGVGIGIAGAAANAVAAANAGAAVVNSGNSSNNIKNTNTQGQQQGQAQGQQQSARSNATGGASNATTGAVKTGDNTLNGGAVTVAVEGAKGDVYVAPAQERNPVATAYAAPLTASNGTCMGSSSAGGQGAALGLSFGTTWTDNNCDIRYDAEALRAAGLRDAAQARLCQKKEIKDAMDAAGTPCTDKGQARRAEAILNGAQVADNAKPQFADPIIRARLGLPPLK